MKFTPASMEAVVSSRALASTALLVALGGAAVSVALLFPQIQALLIEIAGRHITIWAANAGIAQQKLNSINFLFIATSAVCTAFLISREGRVSRTLELLLPAILVVVVIAFVTTSAYQFGAYWLSSDSSSELVGARTLASEHSLFTRNFYYATEFWLIYRHPAAVALFMVTDNWAFVRALNIAALLVTMLLAYGFMMRQTGLHLKYILLSMLLLLMPLSHDWWQDVLFEAYYNLFFAKVFLLMGLFLAATNPDARARGRLVSAVLFVAVSLFTGLDGVRIIYNFSAPLVVAVYVASFINPGKDHVAGKKLAVTGLVMTGIGFVINSWLISKVFHFAKFGYGVARIDDFGGTFFDKLSEMLFGIYGGFFGYRSANVFSVEGIFSGLSLLACIATIIAVTIFIKGMARQAESPLLLRLREYPNAAFLCVYYASAVLFNITFFQFMEGALGPRYLFAAMMFVFPLFCLLPPMLSGVVHHVRLSALVIAIVGLACGNGLLIFNSETSPDANVNAGRQGYLSYLEENSLSYGFASYWNANVTTELSNGTVDMVGLSDTNNDPGRPLKRYKWLSPTRFDDPFHHAGEAFLLLTRPEWEANATRGEFEGAVPAYEDSHYVVIRYDSPAIIHRDVLGERF